MIYCMFCLKVFVCVADECEFHIHYLMINSVYIDIQRDVYTSLHDVHMWSSCVFIDVSFNSSQFYFNY